MKGNDLTILFDANSLMVKRTGVGVYTNHLISSIAYRYPNVQFVGYYYNFLGRKARPKTPSAPNIYYHPIYHFPGPVINLLRRFRIEIPIELLTFMRADFILYPNFLNQPSLFHTPSATVIHDLTFVDLPEYVARKNLSDLKRFTPGHIRRSRFIITVSAFAKKRLHETFHVSLDSILVTPIPPNATTVQTEAKCKTILQTLNIPGKFFLTLSTVEPRKNVLSMLDAYLLLPEKLQKEYTFVITGMIGWNCEAEVARLKQLAKEGKNILHLGYVSDEQRAVLYQAATFYTSASRYEGFGMTPLEAMSYGKACALSDIPVFREVAGDVATYFKQDDPQSIVNVWRKLLADPSYRDRLGEASKRHAQTYDWSTVAASVYNRIVDTLAGTNT